MELIVLRALPQQMRLPASFLMNPLGKRRQNIITAVVTIITPALHKTNSVHVDKESWPRWTRGLFLT